MGDHAHRDRTRPEVTSPDVTRPEATRPDVVGPAMGRHARPDDIPVYGRARVPVPSVSPLDSTDELPVVPAAYAGRSWAVTVTPKVSWRRPGRASRRSLSDGWGFTAAGLLVLFCGWGVWAAAGRGTVAEPLVGFGIVVAVGVGVFALSRLIGRIVLAGLLRRPRLHARYAHLLTGLFLAAAGVAYFSRATTTPISDGVDWVREEMQRLWDSVPH
jgi:hypothetical protein